MVLAGLMMPAVAQQSPSKVKETKAALSVSNIRDLGYSTPEMLPATSRGTLVEVGTWTYAGTSENGYDRQTQGAVYPMTQLHDDGFIGCTWTNEDNSPYSGGGSNPKRGVGYACSRDGGATWEGLDLRIGGIPLYWPSYAQWGENGEVVLARSADTYLTEEMQIVNGLLLLTRENKGVGEWNINLVPYPEGFDPGVTGVMAWARMATSGDKHQYIHIMSPLRTPPAGDNLKHPIYYYRTQDGTTWEVEGALVPEMVDSDWGEDYAYTDDICLAVRGNTVACSFISSGQHGYVVKSIDNGNTWTCTKFFHTPCKYSLTTADYSDSVYCPVQGCIALDNNDKIHVAFAAQLYKNSDEANLMSYWPWSFAQFLSYWNEDMPMIDGDADFNLNKIGHLLMGFPDDDGYHGEYFDWELSDADPEERLYVISTVPKWPVIGYFTPVQDDHFYTFVDDADEWAGTSYGIAGRFSYPQMAFDGNNKLHLAYLGLLDKGSDDGRWFRHPFYTTTADGGQTWTQTEYLVNHVDLIDQEFAFLTLAGVKDRMYLMAQVDAHAGVFTQYSFNPPIPEDHEITTNYYYYFSIAGVTSIEDINYTPLTMTLFPNPAAGQVTVQFEGKGNITVYNMLGQTVYHAENVENMKQIPLNNMTTGVYFVTVRSGNAVATQKLVVR